MIKELNVDWDKMIAEYEVSGKTQYQFCKEKGISSSSFNKWYNKSKKCLQDNPTWLKRELSTANPKIELIAGKFRLILTDFTKETLVDVLEVLVKQC